MSFAPSALADLDPSQQPDAVGAQPSAPPDTPSQPGTGAAAWLRRQRVSFAWFLPAFAVGLVAQLVNLAGSPQRIGPEGTVTAQAWAAGTLGELTRAPFWFDQAPLGWLQLAGYAEVTGAFERYDVAVLAGREFMVLVTMVSATLLWVLARRLRLSRPAATFALLLFTLSPLALQFHRSVYVDNIAAMWLLAAFVLALSRRKQLAAFVGAAAAFAVAVLSAETVLLAVPLLTWLMWRSVHPSTRRRTLAVAAGVLVLIGAGSVVLVLVAGSPTDAARSLPAPFGPWWQLDRVGIIATGVAAVGALFMRRLRPFGIALLLLVALLLAALLLAPVLLGPGGSVPASFVILLIPFGALLIPAVVLTAASSLLPRSTDTFPRQAIGVLLVGGTLAAGFLAGPLWTTQLRGLFLTDLDRPMRDAESWIDTNVAKDSRLIVDDSIRIDLVRAGFAPADVVRYQTLDTDPAVGAQASDGWRDSDYVVTTASMRTVPGSGDGLDQAIDNSLVVATFGQDELRVDIRSIHPDGIDQANADARSGTADRASAGAQLAANPNLSLEAGAGAGPDAGELLSAGRVDARIILSLGLLLADEPATVTGFPLVAGESDTVRRQVLISSSDDDALAAWFRALESPVAPGSVVTTADGVLVTFPFGEPEGLLPPAAP
ncbi:glycosyltransferase family 39 protein [Herbiconiux sp. P16]|uniref:glycosyltransferase family 39 protein n=1 Tax=Herbiconiux wuyangfengii TaxID=3342794 RepID=UPI0035BAA715